MNILTIDFETFYAKDFSLSKLTTEEYIRDPRFEVIGVAVKCEGRELSSSRAKAPLWFSGSKKQIAEFLHGFDWDNSIALAHNAMFDMAILNWHFDIRPRYIADTLAMARAIHSIEVGGSLAALSEYYNLGKKGTEVHNAIGKKRLDFTEEEMQAYGGYCVQDVELTYKLFNVLKKDFPNFELALIDLTIRMFSEPQLRLDLDVLNAHLEDVVNKKEQLLSKVNHDKKKLTSNPQFAELLREYGIEPPTKISPTTGKETYAFAKSDEAFKKLQEHDDPEVQAIVAARLGVRSTIEETRTQRFIDIGNRGTLPIPLRYYAAHTGRWGGDDKINMQNLPRGSQLKKAMCAPEGYKFVDCDLSQIEARTLAWLAEEDTLVEAFDRGDDVYKIMASAIYDKPEDEINKEERFVGKTTILGAGYGMGAARFREQLKTFGVEVSEEESSRIISIYRSTNYAIKALWRQANDAISLMYVDNPAEIGKKGVLQVKPFESAIQLPSGLHMYYNDLKAEETETGLQFTYKTRMGRTKIYGGKIIENVCQGIARCIMAEQMVRISKRYRVLLTVHDSVRCCVKDSEVDEAAAYVEECMRWTPEWAKSIPVRGDVEVGKNYGECVEWVPNHLGRSAA